MSYFLILRLMDPGAELSVDIGEHGSLQHFFFLIFYIFLKNILYIIILFILI